MEPIAVLHEVNFCLNFFVVLYGYMYNVFFDQTNKFCVLYIFTNNLSVYTSALFKCCRKKKQNNAYAFFRLLLTTKQCQRTYSFRHFFIASERKELIKYFVFAD